ncbi:D-lactaldehyde dehydrogenase [Artomyces pyxidatus]|uniref:D-lactaldehyde dehydrogenase n=1 Tax=Artomyces pyxidatus TaxID=48021 RepID=A0ACB8SZI5_9AGAM|nr:D-lactaldehyde dehydrogenase [Artomyces pyxidatus]
MPSITSGTVLVTGASGYIGAWVVRYLVDQGYSIIVAVRNDQQGEFIVNRFPEYKGKVSHINVPDIQKEGAYDEAVKGVDAIIHAASPVVWIWEDPEEIIGPAIKGATGILRSAQKYGTNVKRVLITSSTVAIHSSEYDGDQKPGLTYDENTWNIKAMEMKHDKSSSPWLVYNTAKTRAEKAAFDYVRDNKPAFDLVTILPTYNWGPHIHQVGKEYGSTPGMFLSTFASPDTTGKLIGDWVDVRDCARLHVLALQNEAIAGERLITTNGLFAWQDLYDILNDAGYDAPGKETKGVGNSKQYTIILNDKTFKFFPDFKYRSLEESVREMGEAFKEGGFIQ